MKIRRPWILYAVTFVTSGYFGFVWLAMLMSDVNKIEGRSIFPRSISAGLITVAIAYLFAVIVLLSVDFTPETAIFLFHLTFILWGVLVFVSAVLMVFTSKYVARCAGTRFRLQDAFLIFLLFVFGLLALPITQSRLNALVANRMRTPSA